MDERHSDPPLGGTVDRILSVLPSLVPSAQRVALLCAQQPERVIDMSGADLAAAAGTSPATVSRASRALGFRSFQHLRLLLVRDLGAATRAGAPRGAGTAGWLAALAADAADMLRTSLSSVDAEAFDRAVLALAAAPRVLVAGTGASHPPAQGLALALVMNGRPCEAPADAVAQQLTARVLTAGDVCLVVTSSGANTATLATAAAAREAGATVIGVTTFARAPIAELADIVLVAGARFRAWDTGTGGGALVQGLLLTALQTAVSERMADSAARAGEAIRAGIVALVADDPADDPEP